MKRLWILAGLVALWFGLRMLDQDNLARTIWGEARGEGRAGMEAVAAVVMNRVGAGKWFSGTVSVVVRRKWQFSAWNEDDPNRAKLLAVDDSDPEFAMALEIAASAMAGDLDDPTGGATHYHDASISPENISWTREAVLTGSIGRLTFYRGVA